VRVAVTGPESTGKSSLSVYLARHFNTVCVPEFARKYLDKLGREYTYDDLTFMAKKQIAAEKCLQKMATRFLFCDTELSVIKIWAEHRYQKCPAWVAENLPKVKYDLYLLCDIDLPWEADPLREHPHMRRYFFDWYHRELTERRVNFAVVSGLGDERYKNALKAIETLTLL